MRKTIILLVGVLIIGVVFIIFKDFKEAAGPADNEQKIATIKIPLIDPDGGVIFGESVSWEEEIMEEARQSGQYIGCGDSLFYTEKKIPHTITPLRAIYEELFIFQETVTVNGREYKNPIYYQAQQKIIGEKVYGPMEFEKVVIDNDTAKVYLTGDYISVGTCEPPRVEAVLIFAAKQFEGINEVKVYLNGEAAVFVHGGI